jgi:glycolate oxidase FAD binding subunit
VIAPLLATLEAAVVGAYPALGVTFACGTPRDAAVTHAALVRARADLERSGGSLILETLPQAGLATLDTWGTPPPSFALMRELKARFDPQRRLNPGCFVGGL